MEQFSVDCLGVVCEYAGLRAAIAIAAERPDLLMLGSLWAWLSPEGDTDALFERVTDADLLSRLYRLNPSYRAIAWHTARGDLSLLTGRIRSGSDLWSLEITSLLPYIGRVPTLRTLIVANLTTITYDIPARLFIAALKTGDADIVKQVMTKSHMTIKYDFSDTRAFIVGRPRIRPEILTLVLKCDPSLVQVMLANHVRKGWPAKHAIEQAIAVTGPNSTWNKLLDISERMPLNDDYTLLALEANGRTLDSLVKSIIVSHDHPMLALQRCSRFGIAAMDLAAGILRLRPIITTAVATATDERIVAARQDDKADILHDLYTFARSIIIDNDHTSRRLAWLRRFAGKRYVDVVSRDLIGAATTWRLLQRLRITPRHLLNDSTGVAIARLLHESNVAALQWLFSDEDIRNVIFGKLLNVHSRSMFGILHIRNLGGSITPHLLLFI